MKRTSFIIVCLALLLGACTPQATPTIDPVLVQASSVAMASTMIAETQAAIPPTLAPTDTPVPSTTPLPTFTETPVPTVQVDVASPTSTVVAAAVGGGDPCNGPFLANKSGSADASKSSKGASVYINNTTKNSVTVALYLSKNAFGQCGYVSYVLPGRQAVSIINVLPLGCYTASAYINDPKKPSYATGGPACITGPDRTTFTVYADHIKITGP